MTTLSSGCAFSLSLLLVAACATEKIASAEGEEEATSQQPTEDVEPAPEAAPFPRASHPS
jgi:hypothetical protein